MLNWRLFCNLREPYKLEYIVPLLLQGLCECSALQDQEQHTNDSTASHKAPRQASIRWNRQVGVDC